MSEHNNVVPLRTTQRPRPSVFDGLTTELVLSQYRAGKLPEGVIVALLMAAGVRQ